jgi:hypothetical protein
MKFPKGIILGPPVILTDVDKFGCKQTAIGIPAPTGERYHPILAVGDSFEATVEKWRADEIAKREKDEAAAREQRERIREEARAREPQSCGRILSASERAKLRDDPELIAMCADEPPINEVCKALWMTHSAEFFVEQLFDDDELVGVLHSYGAGSDVKRLSAIKKHLGAYSHINPNQLAVGEEPQRTRIVVRFPTSDWRRLSFLARNAEPQMIVCGARGGLDLWITCENWPQSKLHEFAEQAIKLGGELPRMAFMPNAPASSLDGGTYELLQRARFVRDQEQYKARNFVLYFQPTGK